MDQEIDEAIGCTRVSASTAQAEQKAGDGCMIVCLDANIVIYFVERNPPGLPQVSAALRAARAAGTRLPSATPRAWNAWSGR